MADPIVDVHCHNFNGDDLPVRGFVQHVGLRHTPVGGALSQLLDALVQTAAPGYLEDKARLDRLLGEQALESVLELPSREPPADVQGQLDAETDLALRDLMDRSPGLVSRVGLELAVAEGRVDREEGAEGLLDTLEEARRAIRWVKIFGRSRLDVTALLVSTFHNQVDLFCPLLVDMGATLGDVAPTTMRQQVELQEKISRLAMRGLLPNAGKARIHPFVGFDPRAEVRARLRDDVEKPLDVVKAAVERYGFVGVKVYPPMGWRPIGNQAGGDMTAQEAAELDQALGDLYSWCQAEEVPITAHCNDSNYADDYYRDHHFAGPDRWIDVLKAHPNLHLNLGHFGGAQERDVPDGWPWKIGGAAKTYPHLYADVGNHNIYDAALAEGYMEVLHRMFDAVDTADMQHRVIYGSDWYMVALHPEFDRFLDAYRTLYRDRFGPDATTKFMGGTALSFLGFDDVTNKNAKRLRARYQRYAPDAVPSWLAKPA